MSNEAINELAKHLSAAQEALGEIAGQLRPDSALPLQRDASQRQKIACEAAVTSISQRKAREGHFDRAGIFGEPAWDILLTVYVGQTRNEKTTIDHLCTQGSTAQISLRWLNILQQQGFLSFFDDEEHGGCRLVQLSNWAYDRMTHYLTEDRRV